MPISYPLDFLMLYPGWSTDFDLVYRNEQSRQANGATRTKDFGTALWRATFLSKRLKPNALDFYKAILESLEDGGQTFWGWPTSRVYPSAHANGVGLPGGTVTVNGIATDRGSLSLSGASGLVLNIGDMISVRDNLYRCVQGSTSGSAFSVRPYLMLDVTAGDPVRVANPRCLMNLVPKSVQASADVATGRGTVSFTAMQYI